ncbi:hypothetical protein JHK84_043307 [Glycine max]|nr:hypothetical protein JHK84_043307 [Glycine max]
MRSQKSVSFLNNEFLKNEELEGQPQDVVNGTDNLNKLLGYCRSSSDKSGNGYDGKKKNKTLGDAKVDSEYGYVET